MPFGRFSVALLCGSLPMGFLFAAIGTAGRETPRWAFALSLLIPAVLWLGAMKYRALSRRRDAAEFRGEH